MRSFQGNGVQGNRDGLGKQSLSLARYPLDVGISSYNTIQKKSTPRRDIPAAAFNLYHNRYFRNVSVIFYPICLFFLYRPV